MEKAMSEITAIEAVNGGISNDIAKMTTALQYNAEIRATAEKLVAAQKQGKMFYMEQVKEVDKQTMDNTSNLSKDEFYEYGKLMLEELAAADERDTEADTNAYLQQQRMTQPAKDTTYKVATKLEYAVLEDDETIIPKSRREYVFWFKAQQRKTARATLEMCRTTYEAFKILNDSEFASFCRDIGHDDNSSTIRKFLAIGKVYPRLIDYSEKLPAAWTNIYLLTQISADDFERCIKVGFAFDKLTGSELKQLIEKTRDINNMTSPFKQDKKLLAYPVAKVFFTKRPDEIDFRLLQKALEEVQARLPVKFQLIGEQVKLFKQRSELRYEKVKQEGKQTAVKPGEWDYGSAANAVHEKKREAA
jgi:hypothetical protein